MLFPAPAPAFVLKRVFEFKFRLNRELALELEGGFELLLFEPSSLVLMKDFRDSEFINDTIANYSA